MSSRFFWEKQVIDEFWSQKAQGYQHESNKKISDGRTLFSRYEHNVASDQHYAYFNSGHRYCMLRDGVHTSQHVRFRVHLERMELVQTCFSKDVECNRQRTAPMDFDVSQSQYLTEKVAMFLHKEVQKRKLQQPDLPEQMAEEAQRWLRKMHLTMNKQ